MIRIVPALILAAALASGPARAASLSAFLTGVTDDCPVKINYNDATNQAIGFSVGPVAANALGDCVVTWTVGANTASHTVTRGTAVAQTFVFPSATTIVPITQVTIFGQVAAVAVGSFDFKIGALGVSESPP